MAGLELHHIRDPTRSLLTRGDGARPWDSPSLPRPPPGAGAGARAAAGAPGGAALRSGAEAAGGAALHGAAALGRAVAAPLQPLRGLGPQVGGAGSSVGGAGPSGGRGPRWAGRALRWAGLGAGSSGGRGPQVGGAGSSAGGARGGTLGGWEGRALGGRRDLESLAACLSGRPGRNHRSWGISAGTRPRPGGRCPGPRRTHACV